jgi:N-acylglucosamine-6-phosphate 2-epimerase
MASAIGSLKGKLVVSCQPVIGGPMDYTDMVVAFARAAQVGGAGGLRIEGLENVRAVRKVTELPIIGLVKRVDPATPIVITATAADVDALARAGADIIAFDATDRSRLESVAALTRVAHAAGKLAMADIATIAQARAAAQLNADIIATTLAGYIGGEVPVDPDIALVTACATLGRPVLAEGRYSTVEQVRAARGAGAWAVVIGSAITRPEHITRRFVEAVTLAAEHSAGSRAGR